ncbi:hypothetical protein ACR784_21510 [Sphingobacterium multivorum]|uniref:hypothetical protein n=1 Tax=Sphingobacterium multivorum TaxID=28454 RepID=UPI003DA400B2
MEIQSSKGNGDLAERMFRYFYRIWDRYKVPITAIAILPDENGSYRPEIYRQEFMGTSLRYDFNSYKIMDQEESVLRSNENPFSVIVLTVLLAIKNKKISDECRNCLNTIFHPASNRHLSFQDRRMEVSFLEGQGILRV